MSILLAGLAFSIVPVPAARAQSIGDGFNPGASSYVYALAVQADAKILVGGYFTTLGGEARNRIARLNPDGSLDATFSPSANNTVRALAVQVDGKIVVGGEFTSLGGQTRNRIARLNPGGSLDTAFNPGADGVVYALVVQADGKIVVGGNFTTLGGQPRERIARLNPDGSLDTAFDPGANAWVWSLAMQVDGKIVMGGAFTTLGGQTRNNIGRLNPDGSLDTSFNPGANSQVYPLAVQADGKIVVGGAFNTLGGQTRNAIGRLNPDGSLDTTFNPGANNIVYALAVQADGKIVVGGYFTMLGGQARSSIGRLNADGSLDTAFILGANDAVLDLAVQADGKIVVGGNFTALGGQTRNYIGRLYPDGSLDMDFNPGANSSVYALALQADGKIVVGGGFTTLGGGARNRIGRLNPDGSLDTLFNPGANNSVDALAVQADGKIVVGGDFTTLGGGARSYIGRLNPDGNLEVSFNPGADGTVFALAVQADGKVVVGGDFTKLGGQTRNYIGRLYPDGSLDMDFNPGANNTVYTLAVQADGKIAVGGYFTTLGGQTRNNIGRLNPDGSLDTDFNPGANNYVFALAVQADGKIVVGGYFTTLGGQALDCIARLNADGSLDMNFSPGAEYLVYALAVQADGKIVVGGDFTTLDGQTRNRIGRLNPDGSLDTLFNPGANSSVYALAVQADGKIMAGGDFTTLGGGTRNRIARLSADTAALQNLTTNPSGTTVTWMRSGPGPEVGRVTFEQSTDGASYTPLGDGTRISGGWQLTGLALPRGENLFIRAHGYYATGQYNGSASLVETVRNVYLKWDTTTTLAPSANPSVFGQSVTFTATVASAGGTPTGAVAFQDGGSNIAGCEAQPLSGGQATCATASLALGTHSISAQYAGDASFNSSASSPLTQTVKADTTTTLAPSSNPSVFGQSVTFTATVTSIGGTPTGFVAFKDGSSDITNCTAQPLSSGQATCATTALAAGTHSIAAQYGGDANFNSSVSSPLTQTVNKADTTTTIASDSPDPSVMGQAVMVVFTVTATDGTPSGYVTVSDSLSAATCIGTVAIGNCIIALNTPGVHTLTATYAGDANFNGSSDTEPHQVKANTTTTITSDSPDPSLSGQSVRVYFTVSANPPGGGTPTGNVKVSNGSRKCTATVATGSCLLAFSGSGTKTITATYAGSASFNGSTDTESHQVNPQTATFTSTGAYDGWILESSETSNTGGSMDSTAATFILGDDSQNRQYRAILSFSTASLPDSAVIKTAVLKIRQNGSPSGTNPFTVLGTLYADLRKGFFGTSAALQLTDFNATATAIKVAAFGKIPVSGWYSATLNASGRSNINKTSLTQFRLYFNKDDNNNHIADFMKFFSGDYSGSTSRPQLVITYNLP